MMQPELPTCPEYAERRSGCEITQHPSDRARNLSDERFGCIAADDVFPTNEVICCGHLPIRPIHRDGPRREVGRIENKRSEREFGVPESTGPFYLAPE